MAREALRRAEAKTCARSSVWWGRDRRVCAPLGAARVDWAGCSRYANI